MPQIYATEVTAYFLDAVAAFEAGGAALNIAGGTLVAGDGNGVVPALSALIAANGVTHEVWRGQTIVSVMVDPDNPAQLDIGCDIPAAIGGVEIGPFTVTEFAILDALGNCCVVGTTNLQKTTSGEGMTSDLAFTAAIVYSVADAVTVTPPSAGYATMSQVISGYDGNLPGCAAPLTKTDTTNSSGWINRIFGIAPATQPTDPVSTTTSAAAMGSGRPASGAEYAAGVPTAGGFAWPWPTLQQVAASFAAVASAISAIGAALSGYLLKSGGTMTGALLLAADPTVALGTATKQYVDAKAAAAAAADVPLAGGTMTGLLLLSGDPTAALGAATKEYVDAEAAAAASFSDYGRGSIYKAVMPALAPGEGAILTVTSATAASYAHGGGAYTMMQSATYAYDPTAGASGTGSTYISNPWSMQYNVGPTEVGTPWPNGTKLRIISAIAPLIEGVLPQYLVQVL